MVIGGQIRGINPSTKADVNAMHDTHVTPLMYAAASGHIDAMKLLLDVGKVDVNELHTNGGSAFWSLPPVVQARL